MTNTPQGPQYPGQFPAPPQPPKPKRSSVRVLLIVGAAVLTLCVLGGVVAAIGGGGQQEPASGPAAPATSEAPTSEKPKADPTTPKAETTKPKPPPEKKWVTVATLSGNANKQGEPFKLSDARTRLTYTVDGTDFVTAAIYVLPDGHDFSKEGGVPDVMVDKTGTDTTALTRDAGAYYLYVLSANCDWTVKVQQLK